MSQKLSRTASRQVWRCHVCQFDNNILLSNCQMCDEKKPQIVNTIIKQELSSVSHGLSSTKTLTCLNSQCKTQNDINQIKCKKCGKFLIPDLQDQQEQEIKEQKKQKVETVKCHKCDFQNDPANVTCVSCDVKMKKKKPARLPKPRAIKRGPNFCQACGQYRRFSFIGGMGGGGQYECGCPDADDGTPITKWICNYCFANLKQGEYDEHVSKCNQKQIFYDRNKNKSYQRCTPLQIDTMIYMHKKCEKLHFGKQKKLQTRIEKLGYKKKDLQNLYHYIVNYAPIIIHMHANTHFQFFVKDTHYRSQFQTSKSSGSLSRTSRISWEDRMFDKMHHDAKDFQRVKYGTMNFTNDPHGVAVCLGYGQSYFLLKQHVRDRCTMTDMDSSSPNATICTFRFCYHLLCRLSDNQIKAAFEGSKAQQVKSNGIIAAYKQIQIHGPVQFKKDIQRVYIHRAEVALNPKCLKQVQEFCKNTGLQYQLFGQQPKPVPPVAGFGFGMGGMLHGASSFPFSSSVPSSVSSMFGGSIFGGPIMPRPPIKYTAVSFPYSSKPMDQDDQQQDYI